MKVILYYIRLFITFSVLFAYGLFNGYDTLELFIYNIYFVALILYLVRTNLLREEES